MRKTFKFRPDCESIDEQEHQHIKYTNKETNKDAEKDEKPDQDSPTYALLKRDQFLVLRIRFMYYAGLLPGDVRKIALKAQRSINATIKKIVAIADKLENAAMELNQKLAKNNEHLGRLFGIRIKYERELMQLEKKIQIARQESRQTELFFYEKKRKELENKIAKRLEQTMKLHEENSKALVTTPYKDIADLLAVTIGTVSGMISKAKKKFIILITSLPINKK